MEQSTLHIKAPHTMHIAAKVIAAQSGRSMNQLILDLLRAEMDNQGMKDNEIQEGIKWAREITRSHPKPIRTKEDVIPTIKKVFPEAKFEPLYRDKKNKRL